MLDNCITILTQVQIRASGVPLSLLICSLFIPQFHYSPFDFLNISLAVLLWSKVLFRNDRYKKLLMYRMPPSHLISLILGHSLCSLQFIKRRRRINSWEILLVNFHWNVTFLSSVSSDVYIFNFVKYRWAPLWIHQLIEFA